MQVRLGQLAEWVDGDLQGDPETVVSRVAGVREAGPGEITFLANPKYTAQADRTRASAMILARESPDEIKRALQEAGVALILVDDPYFALSRVVQRIHAKPYRPLGVSEAAVIGNEVRLGKDLSIHPLARVEDRVTIGDRVTLYPGSFIGEGSEIGEDSIIYPNVTIREGTRIGKRVIIHSGTVVGSDGFGFSTQGGKHHKIPQVGTVVIEDDVELGANVAVDRAALGKTVIRKGTKVDNLVQIAHNVVIGEDCLIVAQAGISGSTELGHHVILAGQVGVVGHLNIGDGVRVGAQSGVAQDVPGGATISGSPTMPHQQWLRVQAALRELPQMRKRVREMERELQSLRKTLKEREEKP